jgi:hypothetical protein
LNLLNDFLRPVILATKSLEPQRLTNKNVRRLGSFTVWSFVTPFAFAVVDLLLAMSAIHYRRERPRQCDIDGRIIRDLKRGYVATTNSSGVIVLCGKGNRPKDTC